MNFRRALISTGIVAGAVLIPSQVDARGWQQWVQQGASLVRRGVQIRNEANGNSGGYHQAPQEAPSYQPQSSSGSPGSNYYNIDPSTMRNPLRHSEPPAPQEQPAYTPPPTYQRPYSSRSAYHTGSDAGSEQQQNNRIPTYVTKRVVHPHVSAKRIERPEKASVVVVHSPPTPDVKPQFIEKPDVLRPATTLDTSWILPTVDRVQAKLRSKG